MEKEYIEKNASVITAKEVMELLDRELDKPKEEADNELIYRCMEIIEAKHKTYNIKNGKNDLQKMMFPEGKPKSEDFIATITEFVKQMQEIKTNN